ncbi:MAG: translation initiation factor IF-3 [Candidatus Staskawiczbacteria bacterium RIFOXYC1_FULL_38_18]|uniref:Translation initiation factor IF-3 n=1 Tax=Candidatus Staskawiczbacteria bacterium RIFOXYC1_FULL_38_18 TaxID=1802229 RepID=A0A1G2JFW7_9BACT|nr:MAG: translation initiation factor IF-3 [Candidatus Staskawiczbacteria bacterium RIFOXYC1_FULL_38_18]
MDKVLINNFIRAKEVRVISETGEQLGIMNIFVAIDLARSKGLDLIQVTEKVEPPVCRIANYGKYLYSLQKKEKKIAKPKGGELKEIRLTFNISPHDMEIRAKQAEKFLKEGDKVKINMSLRGREKAMGQFATNKVKLFLEQLNALIPIKTERELKREPRGFTMIVSKQ